MFRYKFWSLVDEFVFISGCKASWSDYKSDYKSLGQIKTMCAYLLNFSCIWKMMSLFLKFNVLEYLCIHIHISRYICISIYECINIFSIHMYLHMNIYAYMHIYFYICAYIFDIHTHLCGRYVDYNWVSVPMEVMPRLNPFVKF